MRNLPMDIDPSLRADIEKAVETMRRGGVILYPTDTIWGLGCDACNGDAIKRIYDIKQRDDSKALITLVPEASWLERYVDDVPDVALELVNVAVDPLTIVYDRGINVSERLLAPDGSIGIRVTRELYSSWLCRLLRRPVVSTSANRSGNKAPSIYSLIPDEIKQAVDYIAEWRRDDNKPSKPSGVIKVGAGGTFKILR